VKSQAPRDMAASVRQRLLNLAKERGEEFNFVLLRYGLERLLFGSESLATRDRSS
jgi:hypothetical protein